MSCLRNSFRYVWFYSCTREALQNPSRGIVKLEGVPPRQSALELFQDIELYEKFGERGSSSCFLCCRRTTAAASCCCCCRSTHTFHTCSRKGFLQCAQCACTVCNVHAHSSYWSQPAVGWVRLRAVDEWSPSRNCANFAHSNCCCWSTHTCSRKGFALCLQSTGWHSAGTLLAHCWYSALSHIFSWIVFKLQ